MSLKSVHDTDWIFEEYLRVFLTVLSWFVDYDIHPDEFIAFENEVKDTYPQQSAANSDSLHKLFFLQTFKSTPT